MKPPQNDASGVGLGIFRLNKLRTVDTKASQGRHGVATASIGGVETQTTIISKVVCEAKFSQKFEICPTRDGESPRRVPRFWRANKLASRNPRDWYP